MADFLMQFEWFRDPAGYRLLPEEPPPRGKVEGLLFAGGGGKPARIVRNGGNLESYQPLEDRRLDTLYLIFASSARNSDGLLAFVKRFGPLTRRGLDLDDGDEVLHVIEHANAMYSWCNENERGDKLTYLLTSGPLNLPSLDMALVIDPISSRPRLRISPKCLLDALWLQFGRLSGTNIQLKTCRLCGSPFETGPGTGRRAGAQFCSDEHRITFNSQKRSSR